MTTATNPGNYVDFDEYVGLKLEKTRSTIRTTDVLTALAGVAAMFLGYLLIFVVLDQWVVSGGFGVVWRWVLLTILLMATIAWLIWKIGLPSFRAINGLFAAREIERAEPGLKSNLLNLIDLKATGRPINPAIRMAMERQAAIRLQQVDVAHAIDHRPLVRTAYTLLAVVVIFCFYALLSPKKISNSIWRGLLPAAEVPLATVTEILDVKPGDVTVQAHQPFVDVQVDVAGEIPSQVLLLYSTGDGKQDQPIELHPDQQGESRFKGQLIGEGVQGLMHDVTYFVRAGDATSRQYKITVEQPPYAEIESVRIEFPTYMKLQPIEQANNGGLDAWEGAKVLLNAKTNMPVRSAMIQFLDDPQVGPTGEGIPMSVIAGGRQLQAQWTLALRSDGSFPKYYRIHCRTEDGRVTTGHVMNPLTIRPDLPPEVVLMHPERDMDAPANAVIALLAQARDPDFELGYVYLNVEKAGQKIVHEVLSEGRQPKLTIKQDLSLAKLNAAVGDVFDVWIEAYDNKQPRPNTKNTPKVKIRVIEAVSQKQADEQLAEQKERVEQKLADANDDANPDQANAPQPREGDANERQPKNAARPEEADQPPQGDPQDGNPQEGQQGQKQKTQQKSGGNSNQGAEQQPGAGRSNSAQKRDSDKNDGESSKNQSERGGQSDKPLPSDGSQDDAVLERLNNLINKNNQSKKDEPDKQPSNENQQPSDDKTQQDLKSKSPKDKSESPAESETDSEKARSKSDSTQNDSADDPKSGVKDPKQKRGSNKDAASPEETNPDSDSKDENRPNQKQPKDVMKDDSGADGNTTKPSSKKSEDENKDKGATDDSQSPSDKKDGERNGEKSLPKFEKNAEKSSDPTNRANPKAGDKTGDRKQEETPDGSNRDTEKSGDSANSPSADKKSDPSKKDNGTNKSPSSKSEQQDDLQSPAKTNDKADNQDANTNPASDKNLPTGLNEKAPKKGPSEKGGSGKPKNESKDPSSKPDGEREPAPESPNAQKKAADGTEQGVGKPDRDPKSKPTPAKTDDVKRDPMEKPETRPGESSQNPDDKTDQTDKTKGRNEKSKSVSQNDDSQTAPSPDSSDKSSDQMDGKQEDSKSPKNGQHQGKSRDSDQKPDDLSDPKNPNQKDESASTPGDKSDSDGSPSKSGASDSNAKQSSKPGQGDKKVGSQNEKSSADKSVNDKKSADSKSKKDQSGRDKKDKDRSSDAASDKSDNGESGSESGKSDSDGGKGDGSEKGGGQGGKSNGKAGQKVSNQPAGPNTNGGHGGASGDGVADATKGGEVPPAEESDDANLEYNKQATELILQKLKKDLDRGEVDPELLEQLGWTKIEMKQFADRLSRALSESKLPEETAEGKARQEQFQEMLKNLKMQKTGSQRLGAKEPKRDVDQVESKRTPPPAVYRSAYEKWTKDIARQKPSASDKSSKKD